MSKIILASFMVAFLFTSTFAENRVIKKDVRNSSGKLLYRTKTTGNVSEIRDASGKLLMKSRTTGNKTEVRSPSGKLIETIRTK